MRIEVVILVRLRPERQLELAESGALSLAEAHNRQGFIEYRFPAHAPEIDELKARLEDAGEEFLVREERSFSLRELRDAPALKIEPAFDPSDVEVAAERYDWKEACVRCMRVPGQEGTLHIKRGDLQHAHFLRGRRGEILVNESIATRMIKEDVSGCILRDVKADDGVRGAENYFQLIPTNVLPSAVTPPTRFLTSDDACPACGRGGLYLDSMLYYDIDERKIADVNVTAELFGDGPALAPEIVVSQRFYNLLVSAGAKLDAPEPVAFV